MIEGEMIANFNTAPPPGIWITWAWLGVCFLASAVLIVLDALLRSRVILGINLLQNANRRAQEAEDEIIRLESKVEAKDIEILYLRNENETLRELARRKGFRMAEQEEEDDDSDFGQWRARQRWKEHAQQTDDFDFDYKIKIG